MAAGRSGAGQVNRGTLLVFTAQDEIAWHGRPAREHTRKMRVPRRRIAG
jgi:hypothetical protein